MNNKEYRDEFIIKNFKKMTQSRIGAILGIDRKTVREIAKKLKLWTKRSSFTKESLCVNLEALELEYVDNLKSRKECAALLGVSYGCVVYLLGRNKITRKGKTIVKPGMFDKPEGWNPITNSVLDDAIDSYANEVGNKFIKTYGKRNE